MGIILSLLKGSMKNEKKGYKRTRKVVKMDDRFKFRVWSKDCSEYVEENSDWCHIDYNGNLDCGVVEDKDYDCGYSGYPEDDIIIEQCTGLKDKNGKLIYEGDIVKVEEGEWVMYSGRVVAVDYDYGLCGFTPFCEYDSDCGLYNYSDDCVVIGNVHENENLLED